MKKPKMKRNLKKSKNEISKWDVPVRDVFLRGFINPIHVGNSRIFYQIGRVVTLSDIMIS